MSALDRINHAHLELLSIATLGERKGSDIAQTLMDNKHLWTKVYLPDETQEHWLDLMDGETITVNKISFMVATDKVLEFLQLFHGLPPDVITMRSMSVKQPYHSIIIRFA